MKAEALGCFAVAAQLEVLFPEGEGTSGWLCSHESGDQPPPVGGSRYGGAIGDVTPPSVVLATPDAPSRTSLADR